MSDPTSLAAALDQITAQLPPDVNERLDRAIAEIAASAKAPGLAVGEAAPQFTLPDAQGKPVSLEARLSAGPVVLVFYRGEWCPYCNLYLRALQAALPEITGRGGSVIAVSPQSPDHSLSITEKAELEFDVLSDVDQTVIRDYRVQFRLPADMQAVHLDVFDLDLRLQSADGSWDLPVPATFVIDEHGTIVACHVDADYRSRMEPAEILHVLDGIATPR